MTLAPSPDQIVTDRAARSLALYQALVHQTDKAEPALPPDHLLHQVIPALEDDSLGHTLIVAPPASAKTLSLLAACGYWIGNRPTDHIGYFCDTGPRAYERSVAVRDTVEASPNFRAIFPQVKPDKAKGWGEGEWFVWRPDRNDKDASFLAAGVGGNIIGVRLNRIVFDDIANEENMATELQRDKVIRWMTGTALRRLQRGGRAVMICTRWHDADPAAWAMSQGWHTVHIKAIVEGKSYWPVQWPVEVLRCPGGCQPTESGKCRFDERTGQWVNCAFREMGALSFGQQYQGETVDEDAAIFKRAWFNRRYRQVPASAELGVISCDTAGWDEKSTTSDYCAIGVYKSDGQRLWKLDMVNERMSFPEVERALKDLQDEHNLPIVVEDTPWARPLIQRLQTPRDQGGAGCWGVIAQKTEGRSKLNRAKAVAPIVEAGNLLLPEEAGWVATFIENMVKFPNAAHDDIVDEFEIAARYLIGRNAYDPAKVGQDVGRYGGGRSGVKI